MTEGGGSIFEGVAIVLNGAERPPSFRPCRLQGQRFAVKGNGVIETVVLAGLFRLRGQCREIASWSLVRLRRGLNLSRVHEDCCQEQ